MAVRGRQPGFLMSEEHRLKIKNSNILTALINHVLGKQEMSSTQASVGLGLLRKVMPDLQSIEHSGDEANPIHSVSEIRRTIVDPRSQGGEGVHPATDPEEV